MVRSVGMPSFRRVSLAVLVSHTVVLGGCGNRVTPPELHLETPVVDLGVVDPGVHKVSVNIENRGGQPLRIEKVTSSCSCTVAHAPEELPSGAKASLSATVNTGPGPGSARLVISSNDPDREHVIVLAWFGKSDPKLVPAMVTILHRGGETTFQDIEVCYHGGEAGGHLRFLGAQKLPDGMTLELVSENPYAIRAIPGLGATPNEAPAAVVGKAVLRLTTRRASEATLTESSTIRVEHRGVTYSLPLVITVVPNCGLRSVPESFLFSASSLDRLKRIERKALISSDSLEGASLGIARKPDFLDVQLSRKQDSGLVTILSARVASPPTGTSERDEIVLRNSNGAEVKVPVYVNYDP